MSQSAESIRRQTAVSRTAYAATASREERDLERLHRAAFLRQSALYLGLTPRTDEKLTRSVLSSQST